MLLVRADGIGDALACAPLVAALRAAGHVVGALLGTRNRAIFASSAFAAVHVLDRIPWPAHGSTEASRREALAEARVARYDVALVASEEIDAYAFARDAHVRTRIGFINGWEKPLKSLRVRRLVTRACVRSASARRAHEHEVETLFALGAGLTRELGPTRDVARLRALVLDEPPAPHGAVVLQTSAKHAAAGLDRAAFVALARALAARRYDVIVIGEDAALARDIARAADIGVAPALDVRAWKACIAGARALITGDSGAAHVAGMTGVPTIDCFAASASTAYDVRRWSPWAAPHRSIVLDPARPRAETAARLACALGELLST